MMGKGYVMYFYRQITVKLWKNQNLTFGSVPGCHDTIKSNSNVLFYWELLKPSAVTLIISNGPGVSALLPFASPPISVSPDINIFFSYSGCRCRTISEHFQLINKSHSSYGSLSFHSSRVMFALFLVTNNNLCFKVNIFMKLIYYHQSAIFKPHTSRLNEAPFATFLRVYRRPALLEKCVKYIHSSS